MKNTINIFSETGCITHEMLWKYRQGKLSPAEKHAVEVHLTDCELCSDALAGMMSIQSDDVVTELRKSVRKISGPKKVIRFYDYRILSAAAAVGLIIVFTYVINSSDKQEKKEMVQLTVTEPPAPEEKRKDEQALTAADPQLQKASEDLSAKEKTFRVTVTDSMGQNSPLGNTYSTYSANATNVTTDSRDLNTEPDFTTSHEETVAEKAIVLEDNHADVAKPAQSDGNAAPAQTYLWQQNTRNEKATTATGKKASSDKLRKNPSESSKIMYINDLKVARTPAMSTPQNSDTLLTGIPAMYENDKQKGAVAEIGREMPFVYSKTLRDGMNYFNNKQYNEASQTFSIILERLPDDVNSQFYKGLSEMEMQNYSQSSALLNKAMLNSDKTFYEEAKFKLALCYISLNQKGDAEKLLKEIRDEKGFYSEKAAKELKQLK